MKLKLKNIFALTSKYDMVSLVSSSGYEFHIMTNSPMIVIKSRKIKDLGRSFHFVAGQIYETSDKGKFSIENYGEVMVSLG